MAIVVSKFRPSFAQVACCLAIFAFVACSKIDPSVVNPASTDGSFLQSERANAAAKTSCSSFSAPEILGAPISSTATVAEFSVSGCSAEASVEATGDGLPKVFINDVETKGFAVVVNGDKLRVTVVTPSTESTLQKTKLRIGANTAVLALNTGDFTPSSFSFVAATNKALASAVDSSEVTLSGFTEAITAQVSGEGAPVILVNGVASGTSATVQPGVTVAVRLTSSSDLSTTRRATLSVGGVLANFDVTTSADLGSISTSSCAPVVFVPQTAAAVSSTIYSNTVTLQNCTGPAFLSVSGTGSPALLRNGTVVGSQSAATTGDTLQVRLTSSTAQTTSVAASVGIGTGGAQFSATTGDFTPTAFTFSAVSGQVLNTTATSAPATLAGFDGTLTATVTGDGSPIILVNGVASGSSANVQAGNAVALRLTTASAAGTTHTATLSIGGVNASFAATTDASVPTITNATGPTNTTYLYGSNLNFTFTFSEAVTVSGTPTLALTVGSATKFATYISGSGTTALTFRYTVDALALDLDGIAVGAISVSGGTILDAFGNAAALTFTPPVVSGVLVEGTIPTIQQATAPSTTVYAPNQNATLDFVFTFSESVFVTGTPRLALSVGSYTRYATYTAGTTTNTLTFRYIAQANETGSVSIIVPTLALNGGTIKDIGGNNATLTFTAPNTAGLSIDGVVPTIVTATGPAAGTHSPSVSPNLDFVFTFSETVTVNTALGTPRIALTLGTSTVYANYVSGSGSTAITFRYTVQAADLDTDGISINTAAIALNNGTIVDTYANAATLSFAAPVVSGVRVDGVAPTISSVSAPTNGWYVASRTLDFSVTFSKIVMVTGTPQLALTVGSTPRSANYLSGSGSTTLTFRYTIVANELDIDGIDVASAITLSGSSIADTVANAATLSFTPLTTTGIKVDAVVPIISSVTAPANATYTHNQNIDLTVTASKAITVTGSPQIALTVGSTTRYAAYASGSGTTALVFRYTVALGDEDSNGIAVASPAQLNNGTLLDVAGNPLTLAFTPPTTGGVRVDANLASVTAATAPSDGTYANAQNLIFALTFSRAVTVTNTPRLTLTIGSSTVYANYYAGSGSTTLNFYYTVQAADYDTDGIAVTPTIDLNTTGTITDSAGSAAVLTFTAPNTSRVNVMGSGATLDLDFAATTTLDPRVAFTRDATSPYSPGTYVGADGLVHVAAVNLLRRSEELSSWASSSVSILDNAVLAPDGTLSADRVTGLATGNEYISQTVSKSGFGTFTASSYYKAGTASYVEFVLFCGTDGARVRANLANGTLEAVSTQGIATGSSASILAAGSGWYRVSLTTTFNSDCSSIYVRTWLNAYATTAATTSFYGWGAQLEAGSVATNYIRTTTVASAAPRFDYNPATLVNKGLLLEESRTNLMTYSEQLESSAWTRWETTVTSNSTATLAPDGSYSSDLVIPTTNNAGHAIYRLAAIGGAGTYTDSVYVKAAGYTFFFSNADTGGYVAYNLASGTIGTSGGGATGTITAMGNGWYRCSTTRTTAGAASIYWQIRPAQGTNTYTGDGTSGIYFWGAQLEAGAFATSYIPVSINNLATATSAIATGAPWNTGPGGSVIATNISDPIGTTTASRVQLAANGDYLSQNVSGLTIKAGQQYTISLWVKNASTAGLHLRLFRAGTYIGAAEGSQTVIPVSTSWQRVQSTLTFAYDQDGARIDIFNSSAVSNATVEVWGAQLEVGSTATSYNAVGSSASAVARSADVASVATKNTNLLTYSEQFDNAAWGKVGTSASANALLAPDGTLTADKVSEDATSAMHYISQSFSVVKGAFYTASAYFKAGEFNHALLVLAGAGFTDAPSIEIHLASGTVTTGQGSPLNAFCTDAGSGWYRCGFSVAATSTASANLNIYASSDGIWANRSHNGTNGSGFYLWGAQLEPFGAAGTYTQTTATAYSTNRQNITPWYNQTEGTLLFDGSSSQIETTRGFPRVLAFVGVNPDADAMGFLVRTLASDVGELYGAIRVAGVTLFDINPYTAATSSWKSAFGYKVSDAAMATSNTLLTATPASIPEMVELGIFGHPIYQNNSTGYIRRIIYWPVRLSNAEIQNLSQ